MKTGCYQPKNELKSEPPRGTDSLEKPPKGLVPKYIHTRSRFNDVKEAIIRYIEFGKEIPVDWIEEYNELNNKLNN